MKYLSCSNTLARIYTNYIYECSFTQCYIYNYTDLQFEVNLERSLNLIWYVLGYAAHFENRIMNDM